MNDAVPLVTVKTLTGKTLEVRAQTAGVLTQQVLQLLQIGSVRLVRRGKQLQEADELAHGDLVHAVVRLLCDATLPKMVLPIAWPPTTMAKHLGYEMVAPDVVVVEWPEKIFSVAFMLTSEERIVVIVYGNMCDKKAKLSATALQPRGNFVHPLGVSGQLFTVETPNLSAVPGLLFADMFRQIEAGMKPKWVCVKCAPDGKDACVPKSVGPFSCPFEMLGDYEHHIMDTSTAQLLSERGVRWSTANHLDFPRFARRIVFLFLCGARFGESLLKWLPRDLLRCCLIPRVVQAINFASLV